MRISDKKRAISELVAKFVEVTLHDGDGVRWVVGPGDKRAGQSGTVIATIGLRHSSGYEIVLKLDSGKIDCFAPMQLYPAPQQRAVERSAPITNNLAKENEVINGEA
ncbi:hypothetical protein [Pandoraea sp. ISTKB]|uniref:hypothetical protein n=1 Tax=Pandoraea sp. ISTKB TaxID=1586708 RepID=UPI0008475A31|nr:hypothetical protein [Pandoraea sp. ISTKB]ODP34990.1 hypothetical protein A9762_11515 [Pandoraea sp. ISTKB]